VCGITCGENLDFPYYLVKDRLVKGQEQARQECRARRRRHPADQGEKRGGLSPSQWQRVAGFRGVLPYGLPGGVEWA